jgi:(p)ppGpp synthase/HD superfamily hydrolase
MTENAVVENRETFFKRFKYRLRPDDLKNLEAAYQMAKYGHGHHGQKRESGERYFEHLRETALILVDELGVTDPDLVISALLHDILEDSFILSAEMIGKSFGPRVELTVRTVTKPKKDDPRFSTKEERLEAHFSAILNGPWEAQLLKLVDRTHNLRTIGVCPIEKQRRKRDETINYILPILEKFAQTHPELGLKVEELLYDALEPILMP